MRTMRSHWLCCACLVVGSVVSPAHAQTQQQIDWCVGKNDATPDLMVGGCTAAIQSGKWSGENLAWAFGNRGLAHMNNDDYEKAIQDFDQAIRLKPDYALAFRHRGDVYKAKGDYDRALADYGEAIRLEPKNADAFTNRGRVYESKKQYDRAISDYAKAVALEPDHASAWAYQGDSYYYIGQPEQAINSFAEAIKHAPDWMWPYNDRGELYLDRDDYDLAIKDFDQVVRVSATKAMGWNNRCRALAIVGRLEQALSDCNEALKISPKFVNYMVKSGKVSAIEHRGLVHLKAGRFDLAIDDFDKAFELTPNSAEVLYSRGIAKLKKGDAAGGNSDIEAAKAIQPDIGEKLTKYGVK